MYLKYEHGIYKESFESDSIFKKTIQKKIEIVEGDLKKLKKEYEKIEEMDNNSKVIANFQYDLEDLIDNYKITINKLEKLKNEIK